MSLRAIISGLDQSRRSGPWANISGKRAKPNIYELAGKVAEVPLADERQKQQLHQLGAGGTGVFKKAGNASQRAAKRDS